jgi:hypothetical protein
LALPETGRGCSSLSRRYFGRRHTNGSERDIRCQVIKRKIGGGTHSDAGGDCRDAFFGLLHTCAKLGIGFWDYIGDRLGVTGQLPVPELANLIRAAASQPEAPGPGFCPGTLLAVAADSLAGGVPP